MVEYTRVALNALIREIQNSIGFLEHRHEETIRKVYVSGGPAKSQTLLKVLSRGTATCRANRGVRWRSASRRCRPIERRRWRRTALDLNVACGAAAELLKGN